VSRPASISLCRHCGWPVLVGDDADICAFTATAEVTPINPGSEHLALLEGRATYTNVGTRSVVRLQLRDAWAIAHHSRLDGIHAEHRCGRPLPRDWWASEPAPGREAIPPY